MQAVEIRSISFEGLIDNIEAIWESNHVLIQPSRLEGLPLSVSVYRISISERILESKNEIISLYERQLAE